MRSTDVNRVAASNGLATPRPTPSTLGRENVPSSTVSSTRLGRSGSILRRQTVTSRPIGQTTSGSSSTSAAPTGASEPSAAIAARWNAQTQLERRRLLLQQNRKSVGPGVLDYHHREEKIPLPAPKAGASTFDLSTVASTTRPITTARLPEHDDITVDRGHSRPLVMSRNAKARSFHPIPQHDLRDPVKPLVNLERPSSPSTVVGRLGYKSPAWSAAHASSLSNKRVSIIPPHATGLGARTISPTDARRMKRLSMLPDRPPIPETPPTPPPDTPGVRAAAYSPSMIPRKSTTPSSSRTTPDSHRRPSAGGVTLPSNPFHSGVRLTSSALPSRLSQTFTGSRLPTPKVGSVHSSVGEEEVPPVPAIPKAYGSPKDLVERSVFSHARSNTPSSAGYTANVEIPANRFLPGEPSEPGRQDRLRPSLEFDGENSARTASSMSRRHLQPLQLPPLNLLPLSRPTLEKVAALQDLPLPLESGEGRSTPYPKRGTKTPSTPMTASKATFFTRFRSLDESVPSPFRARSDSSNPLGTPDPASLRAASTSSSSGHTNEVTSTTRRPLPLHSHSMADINTEKRRPQAHGLGISSVPRFGSERASIRLNGPRTQTFRPRTDDPWLRSTSPATAHPPPSTSNLQRKWSLSFRKGTSKGSNPPIEGRSFHPRSVKDDPMPPPRLPASTTVSRAILSTPSPYGRPTSNSESRTSKRSNSIVPNFHDRAPETSQRSQISTSSAAEETEPKAPPKEDHHAAIRKKPASVVSPLPPDSNSKGASQPVSTPGQDQRLDRDDLYAEEEMRRFASQRIDFEAAAHEMDELRQKANPKDRVAPAQAIRKVNLNIFERGEIIDYKEVYFCGSSNAKKRVGDLNERSANFGFDDERGDYKIVPGDHLAYRYEIVDVLGKGSFGQVVRCVDHKSGGLVAIKIIRNKKRFHQQALIEVDILQRLREWVGAVWG